MKHIGIVACSAEGASLCYRTIVEEGMKRLGGFCHPEITMHTMPLSDYMDRLSDDGMDWKAAGNVMLESIEKLKLIGADFAICPDNTIHEGFNLVREHSALPYIHIIDMVVDEAVRRGMKKLLILGTRLTMCGTFYPEAIGARGLEYEMPAADAVREIDRIIWEDLLFARPKPESVVYFRQIIERHKISGCDGVVLGCTEIPLMINDANSALPVLDTTRLLARAALEAAVN